MVTLNIRRNGEQESGIQTFKSVTIAFVGLRRLFRHVWNLLRAANDFS
jgi:hypothetical protein